MEESTSTSYDIVDVITGEYQQIMEPLSSEQHARLIFKALRMIKRQLRYVSSFAQLPTLSEVEGLPIYSWKVDEAKYRERLVECGLDQQFDLSQRVVELCKFANTQPSYRVFLTQKGEFRIVKQWTTSRWPKEPTHHMELLPAQTVQDLADFLDTPSLSLNDYHEWFLRRHKTRGNPGLWMLNGLAGLIEDQEEQMRKRIEPFTANREALTAWLNIAKCSRPI